MSLSKEQIDELLKIDAAQSSTRGKRGPRVDPTEERAINVWFKLNHHLCVYDCPHREKSPTGKACWNPDCKDTRPETDRGTNIVVEVKGENICRYCFLDGYLK